MQMKRYLEGAVYIAGMIPLVVWKDSVRSALGDWQSLLAVVAYLLVVRLLGLLVVRIVDWSHMKSIQKHNHSVEVRKRKQAA
jgi:hypothetical protein